MGNRFVASVATVRIGGWANREWARTMGPWTVRFSTAALDRAPVNDDGRSGAVLERVLLADGSRVVVKRFDPSVDLVMRLTGD